MIYVGVVAAIVSSVLISYVVNAELKKVLAKARTSPKRGDDLV